MSKQRLKKGDFVYVTDGSYAHRVDEFELYTLIGLCRDKFKVIEVDVSHGFISNGADKAHDIFIENTVSGAIYLHSSQFVKKAEVCECSCCCKSCRNYRA
jgi:hypothetical protein